MLSRIYARETLLYRSRNGCKKLTHRFARRFLARASSPSNSLENASLIRRKDDSIGCLPRTKFSNGHAIWLEGEGDDERRRNEHTAGVRCRPDVLRSLCGVK